MENDQKSNNNAEVIASQHTTSFIKVGGWLAATLLIFGILLGSSWLSLLTMSDLPEEDTRSKLFANYSPWEYVSFQPVDLAIVSAIESDRGDNIDLDNPDEAPEGDWFWATPLPEDNSPGGPPPAATRTPAATGTPAPPSSTAIITPSVTATPQNTPTPPATNTPAPTNTPVPTKTSFPTATKTLKPTKTPRRPVNCGKIVYIPLNSSPSVIGWMIKNNNRTEITIQSITITWPVENGQLTSISLGPNEIWTGLAGPTSVTFGSGDWTSGNLSVDKKEPLVFYFENSVANTGYTLTVKYVGGCSTSVTK